MFDETKKYLCLTLGTGLVCLGIGFLVVAKTKPVYITIVSRNDSNNEED